MNNQILKAGGSSFLFRRVAFSLMHFFLVSCLIVLALADLAMAGGLRKLNPGDMLPEFSLPPLAGGAPVSVAAVGAKTRVLLFLSAENDFQKDRALPVIASLAGLAATYKTKADFLAVYTNAQGGSEVLGHLQKQNLSLPVLDDKDLTVYNLYGVFVMPVVVIAAADGKITAIIPFTHNIVELVEDNLKVALGEWSQADMDKSENVENVEKTPEEKAHQRRLNYSRVMVARKMYPQAAREFAKVIELAPEATEAYLELGYVQLAMKDWDLAEKNFNFVMQHDAGSEDAEAGLGLALYGRGDIDAALPKLEKGLKSKAPRVEIIITLAEIYASRDREQDSLAMYKTALARLLEEYNSQKPADTEPPAP